MSVDEVINWPLAAVLIVLIAGLGAAAMPSIMVRTKRQADIDKNEADDVRLQLEARRSNMLKSIPHRPAEVDDGE